jgi:hypothetical protein
MTITEFYKVSDLTNTTKQGGPTLLDWVFSVKEIFELIKRETGNLPLWTPTTLSKKISEARDQKNPILEVWVGLGYSHKVEIEIQL